MIQPAHSPRLTGPLILLLGGAFVIAMLAEAAAESGNRAIAAVAMAFCLLIAALLVRNLLAVLLFTLCVAMSYNRQFYSFDSWLGDYGSFGLFWTPGDLMMLVILLAALGRRGIGGRTLAAPPRYLSIEIPMLALIGAMALSAFRTDPIVPAMFETLRISKYLLWFVILRAVLDRDLARVMMVGLGAMVTIQFLLGVVQVALGAGGSGLSSLAEQAGELARRATGTTGHPNMYAPFLLMPTMGFIALGASGRSLWRHRIPLCVGVAGALAIVLSQSRAPVAAMLGALACIAVVFMARRILPAPRVIGAAVVFAMLGMVAIAPLAEKIIDRLTGDLGGSIEFRAEYNDAALGIWALDPILGVGPSGFVPNLAAFHPDYARVNANIQPARKIAHVRAIAPVHNVYLWLLAELGLIGLTAFVVFLGAVARLFYQAGQGHQPTNRFFVGVFWGFLGLCVVQLTDFSLWWDHQLMGLAILMGLAAFVRDERRAQ
ncbi:O-antigen ligase family protein [Rhodobacteraceae bacterium KMM 6894]|nr:O-antigen ligase family protein [Rhodobacteraceae bacterium KMM 6894]